jgi:hypothetical protein
MASKRKKKVPEGLEQNIESAKEALRAHAVIIRGARSEEKATSVADLLADLMHFADAEGLEWFSVLDRAQGYYMDELEFYGPKKRKKKAS